MSDVATTGQKTAPVTLASDATTFRQCLDRFSVVTHHPDLSKAAFEVPKELASPEQQPTFEKRKEARRITPEICGQQLPTVEKPARQHTNERRPADVCDLEQCLTKRIVVICNLLNTIYACFDTDLHSTREQCNVYALFRSTGMQDR